MEFVHVNNRECQGMFKRWLGDQTYNFEIHYTFKDERAPKVFRGDYRNLILKPITKWLN